MNSILITGAAGLIGSRLADYILKNYPEYEVIGIDNMFGGYEINLPKNNERFHFYKMDVEDDNLKNIFEEWQPIYVYHLAAYAAEGLSPFIRKFNYKNNVLSTVNIINCCITYNVKRLIYTSSMSVYGKGVLGTRFNEEQIPSPEDPYAISKYACEMDIKVAGQQHGLDWCILRPHNVYGINQNLWDRYRNVLGIWMYQALHNEPLMIYGDGTQTRAFSYIDDCLPCFWNAAVFPQASKQIINIGGIVEYTINDACKTLLEVIGDREIVYKEERYEVKHAVPTFEKSIEYLNYNETTSLKEGLIEMWDWAKLQPERNRFKWPTYEINKGMYSYWK